VKPAFWACQRAQARVGSSMLCTTAVLLCLRSRYVEDGVLDAGICGRDWIVENEADVVEVRRSPRQRSALSWRAAW